MCDMRWEVRDSTVEFLGKAAGVLKSRGGVSDAPEDQLISTSCAAPLLRKALQDPESYVRASSISALAQTLAHGWQQGAALTQEQVSCLLLLHYDCTGRTCSHIYVLLPPVCYTLDGLM